MVAGAAMCRCASHVIRQVHSNCHRFRPSMGSVIIFNNVSCHDCLSFTQTCQIQRRFAHRPSGTHDARVTLKRDGKTNKRNANGFHSRKKESKDSRTEYLFGVAPCVAALQAARRDIFEIYIRELGAQNVERSEFELIKNLAKQRRIPILPTSRKQLMKLSEGRPAQNIVMKTSPLRFENLGPSQDEERQLQGQQLDRHAVWLALDEIQDPMNFGAVLRTSAFLGVDKVVVPRENSAPLSPVVSKASAGAMEAVRVARVTDLVALLSEKVNHGWDVIGAVHPDLAVNRQIVDCEDFTLTKPTLLVLGNEGVGLRSEVQSRCTGFISIFPPDDAEVILGLESLNVSVAAGILLYSVLKKRKLTS